MSFNVLAYAASNKFTSETVEGGGAVKGKNCIIESIQDIDDGHRVNFKWTLDDGTVQRSHMDVYDGEQGHKGDKGDQGDQGEKGDDGFPFLIYKQYDTIEEFDEADFPEIGLMFMVMTKDYDPEDPTVEIGYPVYRYTGDSEDPYSLVVHLATEGIKGEKGDKGDKGEKGDKGDKGDPGSGSGGELERDLTTSVTVGGITAGTSYEDGTPIETILRNMLNPVAYPSLTNPSASMTATGAKLLETGATLNTTFTITFNRGSINPAYGTSGYRSGPATSYDFDGESKDTGAFTRTITSEKTSYRGVVAYSAGEQPKDSIGGNYSTALAAGSVNTNVINYEFVDALWANTSAIATIAKLSLVSKSAKQKDFSFPAQTVANPEVFDVPASWTVTAVQVKNDLSGAYEDAISQFAVTDVTHNDASGNAVAYKRYTFNLGYDTGARSVRLKWS